MQFCLPLLQFSSSLTCTLTPTPAVVTRLQHISTWKFGNKCPVLLADEENAHKHKVRSNLLVLSGHKTLKLSNIHDNKTPVL